MSTPYQPQEGSGRHEWGAPGADPAAQHGSAGAPAYSGQQQDGQHPYGAPVQQGYGSQGQPYGAPVQQGYGSQGQQFAPQPHDSQSQFAPYGQSYGPYDHGAQAYGSQPHAYGSPGQAYGSQPQPMQPGAGHDPYAQQYGSMPGAYGPGQSAYGSVPQGAPTQAPYAQNAHAGGARGAAPERRPGSLLGPLSLRDLMLLVAALLAFIGMVTPFFRVGGFTMSYGMSTVFSWTFWGMGMVFLGILPLIIAGILTLLHKTVPGFPARLGSLSIAQVTSVLASVAFTASIINVLTSAGILHVGAWLVLVASLIAFVFGVFTFLPFLAVEYTSLPESQTHPKARAASGAAAHQQHAGMGYAGGAAVGAAAGGAAVGGAAAYGSQGQAYGSQGQAYGSQGQAYGYAAQPGAQQYGSQEPAYGAAGPYDSAAQQYGSQGQAYGSQGQAYGSQGQTYGSQAPAYDGAHQGAYQQGQPDQFAQPHGEQGQAQDFASPPAADTEQGAAQADALGGHVPGDDQVPGEQAAADRAAGAEYDQSTAEGQAYLGDETASSPAFAQSEPTQSFASGAFDGGAFGEPEPAVQTEVPETQRTAADGAFTAEEAPAAEGRGDQATPGATGHPFVAPQASWSDEPADTADDQPAVAGQVDDRGHDAEVHGTHDAEGVGVHDVDAADAATAEETAIPVEPATTMAEPAEQGAADSPGDVGTDAEPAEHPAVTAQTPVEGGAQDDPAVADASAGGHFRGNEQGGSENEPTQWFRMGGQESAPAADEATSASTYDATQGEPTQAFRPVVSKMFWFAVTEPRPAVDPVTGREIFTVTPNEWFLALEDHGSFFKVRDAHGQEGYLNDVEGIIRG